MRHQTEAERSRQAGALLRWIDTSKVRLGGVAAKEVLHWVAKRTLRLHAVEYESADIDSHFQLEPIWGVYVR